MPKTRAAPAAGPWERRGAPTAPFPGGRGRGSGRPGAAPEHRDDGGDQVGHSSRFAFANAFKWEFGVPPAGSEEEDTGTAPEVTTRTRPG
ncbi:hypothetical protein ACWFMI_10505 [Nocardiopsis terrae]